MILEIGERIQKERGKGRMKKFFVQPFMHESEVILNRIVAAANCEYVHEREREGEEEVKQSDEREKGSRTVPVRLSLSY